MDNQITHAFIHISDLHFGEGIDVKERKPQSYPKNIYKYLFSNNRIANSMKPHNNDIVRRFKSDINSIIQNLQKEFNYDKENFDLYIITGDISNFPSSKSYQFAFDFFFGPAGSDRNDYRLGLSCNQVLFVQGNHDTYPDGHINELNTIFNTNRKSASLVIYLPEKSAFATSRKIDSKDFLFILLDSNSYNKIYPVISKDIFKCAQGNITDEVIQDITEKIKKLKRGQTVDQAQVEDYNNTYKFLILHHPASLKHYNDRPLTEKVFPHDCRNIDRLLTIIDDDFIIIHGHMHEQLHYKINNNSSGNGKKLNAFDSGSFSQYVTDQPANSFYIITFHRNGEIKFTPYVWNGLFFDDDENKIVII